MTDIIIIIIYFFEGVLVTECKFLPSENTTFPVNVQRQSHNIARNENKAIQTYKQPNEPAIEADLVFKITNKKWLDFILRHTKHANETESKQTKKLANENIINRIIGSKSGKENRFSDEINSEGVVNSEKKSSALDYSMEYIDLNSKIISMSSSNTYNGSLQSETNNQIEVKSSSISIQSVTVSTDTQSIVTTTMSNELINLNATLTTISIPYQGYL